MLKMLSKHVHGTPNAKCGIIFCHSPTKFTILCLLCELKLFEIQDFLLHVKNTHFDDNELLHTDNDVGVLCEQYLDVKNESPTPIELAQDIVEFKAEREELFDPINKKFESLYERYNNSSGDALRNEASDTWTDDASDTLRDDESDTLKNDENEDNVSTNGNDISDKSEEEYRPPFKDKQQNAKATMYCKRCDKTFKNPGLLKIHINKDHSENPKPKPIPVKCQQCPKEFTTKNRLHSHKLREHGNIQCSHCSRKFVNEQALIKHEATHTGVKNFLCDFEKCGKSFFTKRRLNSHKSIHTAPKNMVCDICAYSCRTATVLQVHYRTHTGEKPFKCKICSKGFASSSLLSEHKASHSTNRTHVCDVCGASFARQKALYHHKHLHLPVKKFVCQLCGKSYAQAAGLAKHKRKHKET